MDAKLEEATRRVHQIIDARKDETIYFLGRYIRHKSVNPKWDPKGEERTCQEWLRDEMTSWGLYDKVDFWEVKRNRPNVVNVLKGTGGGKSLMFNGHSDVVPVPDISINNWTADPWGGEREGGKVWGRGATDMKAGNTASIWATRAIAEAGIKLRGDVYDTHVIGEESGEHEIGADAVVDRGYKADFLISTEATNYQICPTGVGLYFFRLKITGKPIHTCNEYKVVFPQPAGEEVPGVSAIRKMQRFLTAFEDLEREWGHRKKHPLMSPGGSNISPTMIRGGEYIGGVPENCEAVFNVWTSPNETIEESIKEIREFVDRIAKNDDWLREHPPVIEVPIAEFPQLWPSYDVSTNHPAGKALAEAYTSVLKREVRWGAFPAVADISWIGKKGVPGVVFGPGALNMGVHGNDEYVPVDMVIDCCKIYAEMMLRWCGVARIEPKAPIRRNGPSKKR